MIFLIVCYIFGIFTYNCQQCNDKLTLLTKQKMGKDCLMINFAKILDDVKRIYPTICRSMIIRAMQLYWSNLMRVNDECDLASNENNSENYDYSRQKRERFIGNGTSLRRAKAHNCISIKYTLGKRLLPH